MAKRGSKMKTSTKAAIGVGGAALAAGGIYLATRKKVADPGGRTPKGADVSTSSMALVTSSRMDVNKHITPLSPVMKVKEPYGWFGYLLQHGSMCLAYTSRYMDAHKHILPDLAAVWDSGHGGSVNLDWSRDTLMVNRFAEWPCPAVPRGSPKFLAGDDEDPLRFIHGPEWNSAIDFYHEAARHTEQTEAYVIQSSGTLKHTYMDRAEEVIARRLFGGMCSDFQRTKYCEGIGCHGRLIVQPDGSCFTTKQRTMNQNDLIFSPGAPTGPDIPNVVPGLSPIRPAYNVQRYINTILSGDHRTKDKQLVLGLALLMPNQNRRLVCPPYWRTSHVKQHQWWNRITYWYYNAAWLVWCGEMMRLHFAPSRLQSVPSWWRNHCVCWGIGVPTTAQATTRKTYNHPDHWPQLSVPISSGTRSASKKGLTLSTLWDILHLVVAYTPIPGTVGAMGEQIVPDIMVGDKAKYKRHLLDIPVEAGSIQPPVKLDLWALTTINHWSEGTTTLVLGDDVGLPVIKGVYKLLASLIPVAGTAMSAITSAVQTVLGVTAEIAATIMKIVTMVLTAMWKIVKIMDSGRDVEIADIVGLAGDVVGAVQVGVGNDIQEIPPGLWEGLKTVGAKLDSFGAWSNVGTKLYTMQSAMCLLRDFNGWDYLDEAFSGVGLSDNAMNAFAAAQ